MSEGLDQVKWDKDGLAPAIAQDAATGMKITAQDLKKFGVIDTIITEPPGGAHRDPALAITRAGEAIAEALAKLAILDSRTLINQRADKFLAIGRSL